MTKTQVLAASAIKIGTKYNWKNQPERLVYLGYNWCGDGYWHQFALVERPDVIWCEVLPRDMHMLEETAQPYSEGFDSE